VTDDNLAQTIQRGRACVRMIEAAEVLLAGATVKYERVTYAEARELARQELRALVPRFRPS
jgi:hypothetical protein